MKILIGFSLLFCAFVNAEIYVVPLRELKFEKKTEKLTKLLDGQKRYNSWSLSNEPSISARTPDGVTAYIAPAGGIENRNRQSMRGDNLVAIDVKENKVFHAHLDIPEGSKSGVSTFKFSFDPKDYKPAERESFDNVKKSHYRMLVISGYIGAPWFNEMADEKKSENRAVNNFGRNNDFSFYTGGRAISDNLALDRDLRLMKNDLDANVDISSLEGIKTKEIDWKDLMPKEDVTIDSLALLVPEDQHVLICPSLVEMNKVVSLIEEEGSPLAQSFTVRNPFRTLPSRYKKQLGLDFPAAFARLVPVKSVAVTGYDPFFPTGTDVAVLLESDKPETLFKMLDGVIKTPDKNLALVGKVVVVSNSKAQLRRIQDVHAGKIKSLGSLDEYTFFRYRYPLTEKRTGFVFLSDACIRRWGGPQMRIAASRRTKSIAALNYLTARHISKGGMTELNEDQKFLLGNVGIKDGVIESDKMGSLHFMTPSIDMQLEKVTKTEANAYAEWKRGYEQGWRAVFDPIGFSFAINEDTKELDLTVMPLTVNSAYKEMVSLVGKAVLSKRARLSEDEHVFTASMAIDKNGEILGQMETSLSAMMPGIKVKPLAWLGSSITLFAEKDARWKMLENSKASPDDFIFTAPIGLRVEHTSQIKLATFLLAMKGTSAAVAPGALKWEAKEHGEVLYTVVSSQENLGIGQDLKICYAITKDLLTITFREDVLKRELDRKSVDRKIALTPVQENADHFYLKSNSQMLMAMTSSSGSSLGDMRRKQSYRAIPILNEWKRMFNKENPVTIHFNKFGEDVFCPGGKGYVWNQEDMTMESVVYGHPAEPKKIENDVSLRNMFGELETSMKFEHDGIRVRLKISKAEEEDGEVTVVSPGGKLLEAIDITTKVGARWEYDIQLTEDGKVSKETEIVENVSFKDGIWVQKYSGFYTLDDERTDFKGVSTCSTKNGLDLLSDTYDDGEVTITKYHPGLKLLPKELRLGLRKMYESKSEVEIKDDDDFEEKIVVDITVAGVEDVTIGDKVYKGCYKIIITEVIVDNENGFYSSVTTNWFYPKIGAVKYISKDGFSETIGLLKEFTP